MDPARELIGAFLESDLPAAVTVTQIKASQVYRGQRPQANRGGLEIRIAHRRRRNMGSKTGRRRRHELELVLTSTGNDAVKEEVEAALLSDIADELVDRYDGAQGGLAIFRAAIPALRFEKASCFRAEPRPDPAKNQRTLAIELALDIWE